MTLTSCALTDHQRLELQIGPSGVPHRPAVDDVRDSSRVGGERLQRHVPRRDVLPTLGGSVRGGGRRVLHPGAALRREVGLCRDGEGRGGLPRLQPQPVCVRIGRSEVSGVQSPRRDTGVLPGDGEMQLPAVLR